MTEQELRMAEQELKEKIEHILYECNTLRIGYQTARDQLFALIKEAGYVKLVEDPKGLGFMDSISYRD